MGVVRRKPNRRLPVVDGWQEVPDLTTGAMRRYCVSQAAWDRFRMRRASEAGGLCQRRKCWAPFPHGDIGHIRGSGAGGDDSDENTEWVCRTCHMRDHQPKSVPRKRT